MTRHGVLTRTVTSWHIGHGSTVRSDSVLVFDSDVPVAIGFRFGSRRVRWATTRALVDGALDSWRSPVGLGDLRAWATSVGTDALLRVEVRSSEGRDRIDLPWRGVCDFVRDAYRMVPAALESRWAEAVTADSELRVVTRRWAHLIGGDR